jgi:peptidyl-prolyl cis-trans isomerase SurA
VKCFVRVAAAALALCLAGPTRADAEIIDRILARVNDTVVTQTDMIRMLPIYVQVMGVDPQVLDTADGRRELSQAVLDMLVDGALMLDDASARDLSITDAEVEAYLVQQQERLSVDAATFAAELDRQGIDIADFREFVRLNLTRLRLVQLDVVAEVEITDDEIAAEIAARYPDGLVDTYISTSHVLVAVPASASADEDAAALATITGLRAEIAAGRAFEDVAGTVNGDASRGRGGRLGSFRTDELDPDYVRGALELEIGAISEPIRSRFGWHLIRLDAIEHRETTDADSVRARVEYELHDAEASRQEDAWRQRLRSEGYVDVVVDDFTF